MQEHAIYVAHGGREPRRDAADEPTGRAYIRVRIRAMLTRANRALAAICGAVTGIPVTASGTYGATEDRQSWSPTAVIMDNIHAPQLLFVGRRRVTGYAAAAITIADKDVSERGNDAGSYLRPYGGRSQRDPDAPASWLTATSSGATGAAAPLSLVTAATASGLTGTSNILAPRTVRHPCAPQHAFSVAVGAPKLLGSLGGIN